MDFQNKLRKSSIKWADAKYGKFGNLSYDKMVDVVESRHP
jgi:hypothetical protein